MRRDTIQQWLVFGLLVAIGVVGRWGQPQWNVTPLAATALFAGYYFAHRGVALLVPIATLTITNFALPNYDNIPELAIVYFAFTLPVWIGGWMRRFTCWPQWLFIGPIAALVPSVLFYLLSNFAVWASQPNYPHSLYVCYEMAIPFFRWMAEGDLVYTAALFGSYAFARRFESRSTAATA